MRWRSANPRSRWAFSSVASGLSAASTPANAAIVGETGAERAGEADGFGIGSGEARDVRMGGLGVAAGGVGEPPSVHPALARATTRSMVERRVRRVMPRIRAVAGSG